MRIQTPAEREAWKAELRPKVEAIYRGHVGAGADAILADIATLDDRFDRGQPETAPVVVNMASLINQPGPLTAQSHHMSFTHARLKQLVRDYTGGAVALHEMTEEEQEALDWFALQPGAVSARAGGSVTAAKVLVTGPRPRNGWRVGGESRRPGFPSLGPAPT